MSLCPDIRNDLNAYADRELPWSRRRMVRRHLAACADCAARLREYEAIRLAARQARIPETYPKFATARPRPLKFSFGAALALAGCLAAAASVYFTVRPPVPHQSQPDALVYWQNRAGKFAVRGIYFVEGDRVRSNAFPGLWETGSGPASDRNVWFHAACVMLMDKKNEKVVPQPVSFRSPFLPPDGKLLTALRATPPDPKLRPLTVVFYTGSEPVAPPAHPGKPMEWGPEGAVVYVRILNPQVATSPPFSSSGAVRLAPLPSPRPSSANRP